MKQQLLIDTDILIDVSRGIKIAIARLKLEANNSTLAINAITQMELIVYFCNKIELQNSEKFGSSRISVVDTRCGVGQVRLNI